VQRNETDKRENVRDMKKELQGKIDGTLGEHQNEWLHIFNAVRLHEALGMKTPAEIYKIRYKISM